MLVIPYTKTEERSLWIIHFTEEYVNLPGYAIFIYITGRFDVVLKIANMPVTARTRGGASSPNMDVHIETILHTVKELPSVKKSTAARVHGFLCITSTTKAFAQLAPYAAAYHLVGEYELRFALAAEAFLSRFHWTFAGGDGHWAKLNAAAALLAEVGSDAKWIINVAILAPSYKANCPGLPDLSANPHASST